MAAEEIGHQVNLMKLKIEGLAEQYFGAAFCHDVKQYMTKHPFVAVGLSLLALWSLIPVLIFLCFAVVTVSISILCFICIEGSILLFGILILGGVVFFIAIVTAAMTVFIAVSYWVAQKMHRMFCRHIPEQYLSHLNPLHKENQESGDDVTTSCDKTD